MTELTNKLKSVSGDKVSILYGTSDPETSDFGEQIASAVKNSGATTTTIPAQMLASKYARDTHVIIRDENNVPKFAEAFVLKCMALGLACTCVADPNAFGENDKEDVRIIIGPQSPK